MSKIKLLAATVTVWPERALIALMSLAFTLNELLMSPDKKPIDNEAARVPLTPAKSMRTRRLSGTLVSVTSTSFPDGAVVALPTGALFASNALAVPAAVMGASN